MKRYLILLFCFFCISGCRYYKPEISETSIPLSWKEEYPSNRIFQEKNQFWRLFEDPILNQIEEETISANFDLQIACSRILQARALVHKEHGVRLPRLDLSASLNEDETLLNPRFFGSPIKHLERVNQQQYFLLLGLDYELDLWGKLKDKERSAHYRYVASSWEHEFVYQTLITDVALHYFSLRTIEEELLLAQNVIDSWKDTVFLYQCLVQAGLASEIDLARASLELALAQAEIEQIKHQYNTEENALAALMGKPAPDWKIAPGKLTELLPSLPVVLPSEVLLRRADIQAAQALVSAGRIDVDIAIKSYFPSFPLTADLGLSSPFLSHFFTWQARYWEYVLNAVQTLFDGGQKKAEIQRAKAQFMERFAFYQKTVTQAFKDVEDALSSFNHTALELQAQKKAIEASLSTCSLAKEQFNSGLISYLLVADSEKTSIAVKRQETFLKGQQIAAWIRLLKAIGIQQTKDS
jgi:multidrug efflux system outer membrane protein